MNHMQLADILEHEHIDPNSYSIGPSTRGEQYCIEFLDGSWAVYYAERGLRTGIKNFDNEGDACQYLLTLLRRLQRD